MGHVNIISLVLSGVFFIGGNAETVKHNDVLDFIPSTWRRGISGIEIPSHLINTPFNPTSFWGLPHGYKNRINRFGGSLGSKLARQLHFSQMPTYNKWNNFYLEHGSPFPRKIFDFENQPNGQYYEITKHINCERGYLHPLFGYTPCLNSHLTGYPTSSKCHNHYPIHTTVKAPTNSQLSSTHPIQFPVNRGDNSFQEELFHRIISSTSHPITITNPASSTWVEHRFEKLTSTHSPSSPYHVNIPLKATMKPSAPSQKSITQPSLSPLDLSKKNLLTDESREILSTTKLDIIPSEAEYKTEIPDVDTPSLHLPDVPHGETLILDSNEDVIARYEREIPNLLEYHNKTSFKNNTEDMKNDNNMKNVTTAENLNKTAMLKIISSLKSEYLNKASTNEELHDGKSLSKDNEFIEKINLTNNSNEKSKTKWNKKIVGSFASLSDFHSSLKALDQYDYMDDYGDISADSKDEATEATIHELMTFAAKHMTSDNKKID